MDINDVIFSINGAVYEVNPVLGPGFLETEIKSLPAKVLAQARRAGMIFNLPEGHKG